MLPSDQLTSIKTLGQLKAAGHQSKSVKQELRDNLINKLKKKENTFPGIHGYDETVIPELQRAILAGHDINLLGLRGQAKTRIARQMTFLLDEFIPMIDGTDLKDDPLRPISSQGLQLIEAHGDQTAIRWLHRSERYIEKLATPDVTVADLIGDVDPIKAATMKLSYADERVIHYGLVPRSNRCIFVINELPDLQARIQVALFNILQEGDVQIRGFQLRLPLDVQFLFTANPEDYTNRGSIVTPLKDRIGSQIITHYPKTIEIGRKITQQEAKISASQQELVTVHDIAKDLIEQIAFEARESKYIDEKSGVSARLTISAYESLISAAERRALMNGENKTYIRISDFWGVIPAITGKVELVYEGEQEGARIVAHNLIGRAIRKQFLEYFPNPEDEKKNGDNNRYAPIIDWFGNGESISLLNDMSNQEYKNTLFGVPGLMDMVREEFPDSIEPEWFFLMEFMLHGLAEFSQLSKNVLETGTTFADLLSSMFQMPDDFEDDEDDELR